MIVFQSQERFGRLSGGFSITLQITSSKQLLVLGKDQPCLWGFSYLAPVLGTFPCLMGQVHRGSTAVIINGLPICPSLIRENRSTFLLSFLSEDFGADRPHCALLAKFSSPPLFQEYILFFWGVAQLLAERLPLEYWYLPKRQNRINLAQEK